MAWTLKKSKRNTQESLTDEEMAAVEEALRYRMGEPQNQTNILFRAWQKIVNTTVEVRNGEGAHDNVPL